MVKNQFDGDGCNCNTILDVGCGAGTLSILLADWFKVYSLDFSKPMLARLKKRARELKKDVSAMVNADNQKIPFKSNSFDGTLCKFALWPRFFQTDAIRMKLLGERYPPPIYSTAMTEPHVRVRTVNMEVQMKAKVKLKLKQKNAHR